MAGTRRPNGTGTAPVKRSDGRYQAAVYVPQPDGTMKRKYVYDRDFAECDRKMRELLERAEAGVPTPTKGMTVGEWLDYWLEHIVRHERSAGTHGEYSKRVRLYLKPKLGSKKLVPLQVKDARLAITQLKNEKGSSVAELSLSTLKTALYAAIREDIGVKRNVAALVQLKAHRPRRKRWKLEHALTFLAQARGNPLYPLYLLIALLGLRTNEAMSLRWEDVDFDERVIYLEQQFRGEEEEELKTEASKAPLPLPNVCIAPLRWQRLRQADQREWAARKGLPWYETGAVFTTSTGRPVWGSQVRTTFQEIARQADLPEGEIRTLRRLCGTLLVHLKVHPRVAMAILRHSRIATTMEIYASAPDEDVRDAVGQLDKLLRNHR